MENCEGHMMPTGGQCRTRNKASAHAVEHIFISEEPNSNTNSANKAQTVQL